MAEVHDQASPPRSGRAEIQVRQARPEDDAKIGELLVEAFVSTYARKMPEVVVSDRRKADLRNVAPKREKNCVLVAEKDSEIIGTVTLFRPDQAGPGAGSRVWVSNACELRFMAVDPRFHGRDVARLLLDETVQVAQRWGASGICLHVRRGATGVARLYERLGYVRVPSGDYDDLPEIYLEAYFLRIERD